MPDSTTNEMLLQPNPYAGGRPILPICMPLSQPTQPGAGGNAPNGSAGPGGNSLILDDDVSLTAPSTGLNGTVQPCEPFPEGNIQPSSPGSDFTNTVPGMMPGSSGSNGPGQAPPSGNATGWRKSGDNWYYFDPDNGTMVKGWKQVNGLWYYLDPQTGIMATGWVLVDGLWYYLEPQNGHMLIDWQQIDGEWYYLETTDGNGQMVTGWKLHRGKWYFLLEGGDMAHGGWLLIQEKWYCFQDEGQMEVSKILEFNEKKYYVGDDGAMVTSETREQVIYEGVTYDVAEDGVCTAIQVTVPSNANIQAWRTYISNDTSLSETRKTIVLEAFKIIEQGCVYHQLRSGVGTPSSCMKDCDGHKNPKQNIAYNFHSMANYNLDNPLYLDCSFFVKHCYWKAGIEMVSTSTEGLLNGRDFDFISKDKMKMADIAVYREDGKGHAMIFVGWTSGHEMVWAEMKSHGVDGRVSAYTPASKYSYKKYKNDLG